METSFPPVCDFLLTPYTAECFYMTCLNLPAFLPISPFMVIKMNFSYPLTIIFFFPAAGTAVSALMCLPFLREFYISQSLSRSTSYNTALRKQALVQPANSRLPVDPITAVAGWLY